MVEFQLTKDSKELLAIIYKEYLHNVNNGISKNFAKRIGHIDKICVLAPDWLCDDVAETMSELERAGYVQIQFGSNIIYDSFLLDKAIIYFEKKNLKTIATVAEWVIRLK